MKRLVAKACSSTVALGVITLGVVGAVAVHAPAASAQAKPAGADKFCAQIKTSQANIAKLSGTQSAKNSKIASEWAAIEKAAPAALKSDVTAIKTAFTTAAKQNDADAKKTLSSMGAKSKKITDFVSKNCAAAQGRGDGGPGGRGDRNPAEMAKARECMAKAGFTFGEPGDGSARPNFDDPKFQAAAQKCGLGFPGGPGGGRGGRGLSDKARACVKAKGIELPERGARPQGGQGQAGQGQPGGPGGFDEKTRAAIQECRAANP